MMIIILLFVYSRMKKYWFHSNDLLRRFMCSKLDETVIIFEVSSWARTHGKKLKFSFSEVHVNTTIANYILDIYSFYSNSIKL